MKLKAKAYLAMLMVLSICLSMLPVPAHAAATADGETVTALGTGAYSISLKNDCDVAVDYSVTAGEVTKTVTLEGNETLKLLGDAGEAYSVTWQGSEEHVCSQPAQTTKSGTFGQAPAGYDGFDGYDENGYTNEQVSNDPLYCSHAQHYQTVDFYYVNSSVIPFYTNREGIGFYYLNELTNEKFGGLFNTSRGDVRDKALNSVSVNPSQTDRYTNITEDGKDEGYMWVYWKATPYLVFSSEVSSDFTLTLVNDCDASVQYQVTIGEETQTVTLTADEQKAFTAPKGTAYTITWVGGTDSGYAYVEPTVTEYTGVFGENRETVYYVDGAEYNGEVSDTVTYNKYTMSAGTLYAVDTLKIFTRTKNSTRYIYTNIQDSGESYSATSASGARDNIMKSHAGYNLVADDSDLGYAWVFKPVTTGTVTTVGNSTVTVATTAVTTEATGTFKVAALNVDGMPQNVKIASVYDLKLNEDGPGAEGSTRIGQYIEAAQIDLLGLSENFNFFQEINAAAPSYATMTQRERIPTEVGVGDLNNDLFPFDTDGLNLMYKNNLTVSGESMAAWNTHYSPSTDYVVIQVPDQNGADGMIDKGYRFYQAQVAPGVAVDVYILHMDAETSEGDNAARADQINQLLAAIEDNHNGNPIIIMGDTNCRYTRDPLESTIIAAGFSDPWIDLERDGDYPQMGDDALMVGDLGYQKGEVVDKVFYRNVEGCPVQIEATNYVVDAEGYTDDGGLLGDHPPVIVTFSYSFTANPVEHVHQWDTAWTSDAGYHWHECTVDGCGVTMNSLKDGYAAHTYGEYTVTKEPTCSETGVKTRTCTVCGCEDTAVIPTTAHTYDEGKVTKEPTATEPGEKTFTCTECGHKYTEEIPAVGVAYIFTLSFDKDSYNVGDTATVSITLSSNDEGTGFSTLGFKLDTPAELTLQELTTPLQGGSVSQNGGNFAYNVNSGTPVSVTADGVKVAEAIFTVNGSFETPSKEVTISLSDMEVTEVDAMYPTESSVVSDSAVLHRTHTITFTAGAHVTGLTGETTVTVPAGTAFKDVNKPGYTLEEHYTFDGWYNGDTRMTDDTVISGNMTLTAKASAKQFDFTTNSGSFTIGDLTGVTDGKATYGTDVTFTVTPSSSYVLNSVTYTVNGENAQLLTAQDGVYTIPGSAITGAIAVEVTTTEYHTVQFVAGTGVTMEPCTAYVKDGQAALYTDTTFTKTITIPVPQAQAGYRLAADTAGEPLWSDGVNKYQTSALGTSVTFTENATLTAQAVKVWNVTFAAGEHGSLAGETAFVVDDNATVPADKIPAVTANAGYTFTGWNGDVKAAITADTTFTAQYENAVYALNLPTVSGVSFEVDGATQTEDGYTVTHGTDVTITMTTDDTVKVTGLSYQIGSGESVTVENMTQPFTIHGEDILGSVTVNVTANAIYQITVTVEGGNGTVNGKESDTITFDEGTSAENVAKAFTFTAAPGYEPVVPVFETVTADKTYTVTFTHASYSVTWPEGVTGADTATHGTDLTFTAKQDGHLVLDVQYKVGDGELVTLEPNADGTYTIPGAAITGPITVHYTTVEGTLTFISETEYMAAPAGKQVAVLSTAKLASGTYAFNGYGDLFWSAKYNAYVYFVDNAETADTLTRKLAVSENAVTEIDYSGDINHTETVTPADSAPVNAVLHGVTVEYEISDLMRFQFDVTGDRSVSASDIKWILDQYTSKR